MERDGFHNEVEVTRGIVLKKHIIKEFSNRSNEFN